MIDALHSLGEAYGGVKEIIVTSDWRIQFGAMSAKWRDGDRGQSVDFLH